MSGSTISTSTTRIEALSFQSSSYGGVVPYTAGLCQVPGNLLWYGGFKATAHTTSESQGGKGGVTTQNTDYTYSASLMMSLGHGSEPWPLSVERIFKGKSVYGVDGAGRTPAEQLGVTVKQGELGQSMWAPLPTLAHSQALAYSGMAYVAAQNYDLGTGAQVENHLFEVKSRFAWSVSGIKPDVDVSDVAADLLTSPVYGAGFPAELLAPMTEWSNYVRAAGLLCSPALTEQVQAASFITRAAEFSNSAPVWSGGQLKFVPYGDQALTANGRTFTPNITPVYDLTDEHYLDKDAPVEVRERPPAERYNHIRIEFRNRGNWDGQREQFDGQYAIEVAEAKDQADIDVTGLRSAPVEAMHWICDRAVADHVAELRLQRSLRVVNDYVCRLPWTFALLEPMDIVTHTDIEQGLDRTPTRITQVEEGDDGTLTVTSEDFLLGIASATLYPSQSTAGFAQDYNVSPGDVRPPVLFEAPGELSTTGLEVYAAVSGASAYWGGCHVWVSLDGSNYKRVATLKGASRYGQVTAPISGGALAVTSTGQLRSGSAADAAALGTLCYVGGLVPEYLAYTTATLTGAGAYTLTGLVRGAYGTPNNINHAAGDAFVRLDDAIAKSGPLDVGLVGKLLQFKFTSFNVFGGGEQSLAEVDAYTYAITGNFIPAPTGTGGPVNWSDIIGAPDVDAAVQAAAAAANAAAVADDKATTANNLLAEWAADSTLSPVEKSHLKIEVDGIAEEATALDAQATAYGITTELTACTDARNSLLSAVNPLLANLSTASAIDAPTVRGLFRAFYAARSVLLQRIAAVAGTRANWGGVSGVSVVTDQVAANAITNGSTVSTFELQGGFNTLGGSGTSDFFNGPVVPIASATDEIEVEVSGYHLQGLFYSAPYASVEVWMSYLPAGGGAVTEVTGSRKPFLTSLLPAGKLTSIPVSASARIVPGVGNWELMATLHLRCLDASGNYVGYLKDTTALCVFHHRVIKK